MKIDKRLDELEKRTGIVEEPVFFADNPPVATPIEAAQVREELIAWARERFGEDADVSRYEYGDTLDKCIKISSPYVTVYLPDNGRGLS